MRSAQLLKKGIVWDRGQGGCTRVADIEISSTTTSILDRHRNQLKHYKNPKNFRMTQYERIRQEEIGVVAGGGWQTRKNSSTENWLVQN